MISIKKKFLKTFSLNLENEREWCNEFPSVRKLIIRPKELLKYLPKEYFKENFKLSRFVDNETLFGFGFGNSFFIFTRPFMEGRVEFNTYDEKDSYIEECMDEFILELNKILENRSHYKYRNYVAYSEISKILDSDRRVVENIVELFSLESYTLNAANRKGTFTAHFDRKALVMLFKTIEG